MCLVCIRECCRYGSVSVWTNQGVLKYACDSRLRLVCQWVCTFLHVPAVGMLCGKSQELTLAAILDAWAITCGEL